MRKTTLTLTLLITSIFMSPSVHAENKVKGITVYGNMGMSGEIDADSYTIKSNGGSQKNDLRDEDLEKGHGLSLTYELPINP